MKEQKFIIAGSSQEVNEWLDKGWEVVSVTAQYVSHVKGSGWDDPLTARGKFAVVIQRL